MSDDVYTVYSTLKHIDSLKQTKRRTDQLKLADTFLLRTILQAAYSPKINFEMPTGAPPIEEREEPIPYRQLTDQSIRSLGQCVNKKLKYFEREAIFTRLCSTTHPDDVKVLVAMKDKTMDQLFPSLTKKFIGSVFPKLVE